MYMYDADEQTTDFSTYYFKSQLHSRSLVTHFSQTRSWFFDDVVDIDFIAFGMNVTRFSCLFAALCLSLRVRCLCIFECGRSCEQYVLIVCVMIRLMSSQKDIFIRTHNFSPPLCFFFVSVISSRFLFHYFNLYCHCHINLHDTFIYICSLFTCAYIFVVVAPTSLSAFADASKKEQMQRLRLNRIFFVHYSQIEWQRGHSQYEHDRCVQTLNGKFIISIVTDCDNVFNCFKSLCATNQLKCHIQNWRIPCNGA